MSSEKGRFGSFVDDHPLLAGVGTGAAGVGLFYALRRVGGAALGAIRGNGKEEIAQAGLSAVGVGSTIKGLI